MVVAAVGAWQPTSFGTMVKPIVVEVEVVGQAEGDLAGLLADEAPPVLVARSSSASAINRLTPEDSVGAGLTAVLERAASSSVLGSNAQRKGASPARRTTAPAQTRTPGSSGGGRPGKADGGKKSSPLASGVARPPRPAKPSLAGLESACEAAMASLAAGQAAPADASGTASKLLEQLVALQSTLATARAAEGGLSELDEAGFDEDDSDDDDEPEADMDEAEENEDAAGGGGTGTDGHMTSGDDTASLRRSGRSGTSATTEGAPAAEGEGEGSESEGAAARERRERRHRRERPSSFIPLDTMSGIEITEPDMMFDSKPLLDPTLAKRLDPMGCFPTCGGGEKRARSGKPDAALVAELNDPACEPLTLVYCLSNYLPLTTYYVLLSTYYLLFTTDSLLLTPYSLLLTTQARLLPLPLPAQPRDDLDAAREARVPLAARQAVGLHAAPLLADAARATGGARRVLPAPKVQELAAPRAAGLLVLPGHDRGP